MTYEQAVALRTHQLCGHYVEPAALAQAIQIIRTTHTPTPHAQARDKRERKANRLPVVVAEDAQRPLAEVDMDAIYRSRAC